MEIEPITLSTGKILYPGSLYKLRFYISSVQLETMSHIEKHPFLWDRIMRFEGRDTTFTRRCSFVFSDDVYTFDTIFIDSNSYDAFTTMTNMCASHIDDATKRWRIHVCEHHHCSGKRQLEVMDL